jgi:hypothetical protein
MDGPRLVLAVVGAVLRSLPGATYWVPGLRRLDGAAGLALGPRGWSRSSSRRSGAVAALPALASADALTGASGIAATVGCVPARDRGPADAHVLAYELYIGLGWLAEPVGDQSTSDARSHGPPLAPRSTGAAQYEADLRGLVRGARPRAARLHRGGSSCAKLVTAMSMAMPWLLLLPFALVTRPRLVLPLAASLVPLLAIAPIPEYATGFLAVTAYALGSGDYRWLLGRAPKVDGVELGDVVRRAGVLRRHEDLHALLARR